MRSKIKIIPMAMAVLGILGTFTFISTKDVYASGLQTQNPEVIFAASCATCHGSTGNGGVSWVRDGISSDYVAPDLTKPMTAAFFQTRVRQGKQHGGMPAFGPEEITLGELNNLYAMLTDTSRASGLTIANGGVPAVPTGDPVILNILDADPWYANGTNLSGDTRRVALDGNDYLKVINTGRTWHTFTNPGGTPPVDSGFIGYAGNNISTLGDMGYYYAEQIPTGLNTGCQRYLCKMHPYMQVEVCTNNNTPQDTNEAYGTDHQGTVGASAGLTRAHKIAKDITGVTPGIGEIWVAAQSQEDVGEDTTTVLNKSVSGMDGAYQVINAGISWTAALPAGLENVGNNPHNAWPGKDSSGNPVVLSANWHDNTLSLMDASAQTLIGVDRRSGVGNAHVMVTPGASERFYITHMGGRALQQINVDLGPWTTWSTPNVFAGHIKGGTGPHGLWMCDDGVHVLTADTFGRSATIYNTILKKSKTASSGGKSPLAPTIMSGYGNGCSRGFTNNALTTDVSIYDISTPVTPTSGGISHITGWTAVTDPGGQSIKTGAAGDTESFTVGNIRLRNTENDQNLANPLTGGFQARWAHLPIQTPVSPKATTHGQFMVTANKASFNVSITALDSNTGLPTGLYTIPAGLGAHGVTYGPKSSCDHDDNVSTPNVAANAGTDGVYGSPDDVVSCFYAYVTNTFEDYVSVYDLEKIDDGYSMGVPGSALLDERVYVEGGAVTAVAALDKRVAGLCDVVDDLPAGGDTVCSDFVSDGDGDSIVNDGCAIVGTAESGVSCLNASDDDSDGFFNDGCPVVSGLVYDFPCGTGPANCGDPGLDGEAFIADYDTNLGDGSADVLHCGVGAIDTAARGIVIAGIVSGTIPDGTAVVPSLAVGHSLYVADLPIGVLCPDCRSGVHAGDIPLVRTTGQGALAGPSSVILDITLGPANDGATSKYTYLKEEVYVDTQSTACALGVGDDCTGLPDVFDGAPTTAGRLNLPVTLDLELGINTGGQGIMGRSTTTGSAPVAPWP